jgi:hypothetical protein
MKQFELPTNDDFEKLLQDNIKHTKPLEMKEKQVNNESKLFPFWTPIKYDGAETFYDYEEYLDKKTKEMRKTNPVGSVNPFSEFKTTKNGTVDDNPSYPDYSIVGKMQDLIEKFNKTELKDKTGIVKADSKTELNDSYVYDTTSKTEIKNSYAAKPKGDNVGVVKVVDGKANTPKQSIKHETNAKTVIKDSNAKPPKDDKVGIVKPKSDF